MEYNQLYYGDCLEVMKLIDDKSVGLIVCDLPYGVTQNEKDITILKSLPNLDYKLICGNSLIGIERSLFNNHLFKLL